MRESTFRDPSARTEIRAQVWDLIQEKYVRVILRGVQEYTQRGEDCLLVTQKQIRRFGGGGVEVVLRHFKGRVYQRELH